MIRQALTEIQTLLPSTVLLRAAPVQDHLQDLPVEEQKLVAHAVTSRRHEFSSARFLAHQLLEELGEPRLPLLAQADRAPAWPKHVIGSLSHSRTWAAAAVCLADHELLGIGVDIEDQRPLEEHLFAELLTPTELRVLRTTVTPQEQSARVLAIFSLKEALYKCMAPLGNAELGFHAVEVDFSNCESVADSVNGVLRPRLVPQTDLLRRLPSKQAPEAYFLQRSDVLFSVVTLTAARGENL
jgi:4'-phosphopantetheinyl transferase EntD